MGASKLQLLSIGPQDYHLTANPQITYFKSVFKRHTNFAMETKRIYLNNPKDNNNYFGATDVKATLMNEGDLLGEVYLDINIKGTTTEKGAYTVNHFGNSLIKSVNLEIGGYVIDTQYSQWMQIYDELTDNKPDHQPISGINGGRYSQMNFTSDLEATKFSVDNRINGDMPLVFGGNIKNKNLGTGDITASAPATFTKKICIPLKFWFTRTPGLYLPLCAITSHEVIFNFTFEEKHKLIGNSTSITSLTIDNINLYGNFIHLDHNEKQRFKLSSHEYLIEQVQLNNNNSVQTSKTVKENSTTELEEVPYEIFFNHPIKYIAWVVVNEGNVSTSLSNNSGQGPCYFVSMCSNSLYGNDGTDGIVRFMLNNEDRERQLPMYYYTRIFPKKFGKTTPELDRIGFYSFATKPFEMEPSGTCNFSKISDKQFRINFANNNVENIKDKALYFFAVNYNVLLISEGMAGLRYK